MGFFDMFSKKQAAGTGQASDRLKIPRQILWMHDVKNAEPLLTQAIKADPKPCLPYSYRSLLRRMNSDLIGAQNDARHALEVHPDCFEAHAAQTACLLTGKADLTGAFTSWTVADKNVPHDAEGHFLRLILELQFFEIVNNSSEDSDSIQLHLVLTPVMRGLIRLLDGYPRLALDEFAKAEGALSAQIGIGLAFFRFGDPGELKKAQDALSNVSGLEKTKRSIQRLLSDKTWT
jgi:hypothetical protein